MLPPLGGEGGLTQWLAQAPGEVLDILPGDAARARAPGDGPLNGFGQDVDFQIINLDLRNDYAFRLLKSPVFLRDFIYKILMVCHL